MMTSYRARFVRIVAGAWVVLALLGAAWSLATPIGGSPDDPAHLIKAAAVARGELTGTPVTGGLRVTVPQYIAYSEADTCFAFHGNLTPKCAAEDPVQASKPVKALTSAGLYNPLYYAMVGWPSLLTSSDAGIYGMRIVSAVIVGLFLAVAFGMIASWRRRTLPLLGFAAALTPMVLFLAGNVNPNSLEVAATLTAFTGVLSIIREPAPDLLPLRAGIVFVSASIAVNMRGLSTLWVAVAVLAPLVLASRSELLGLLKTRSIRVAIAGTAVACIAAIAWLLGSNSLGAAPLGSTSAGGAPGVGTSHIAGFLWNLGSTFFYGAQVVGLFGWLDTPSPAFTYFVWSLLVGALAVFAIVLLRGRAIIFTALLGGALVLLPPIVQGVYITTGGLIWQGRYILPVFVCAMVGIGAVLSEVLSLPRIARSRLPGIVLGLWAAAQFVAFATTLKRYAVGERASWPSIFHPVWSPPGGVPVAIGLYFVVLVVASAALWRLASSHDSAAPA